MFRCLCENGLKPSTGLTSDESANKLATSRTTFTIEELESFNGSTTSNKINGWFIDFKRKIKICGRPPFEIQTLQMHKEINTPLIMS